MDEVTQQTQLMQPCYDSGTLLADHTAQLASQQHNAHRSVMGTKTQVVPRRQVDTCALQS